MENVFWIVSLLQLFQPGVHFVCLGALWEDSIFGQFLISCVSPGSKFFIRISVLDCNHTPHPESVEYNNPLNWVEKAAYFYITSYSSNTVHLAIKLVHRHSTFNNLQETI